MNWEQHYTGIETGQLFDRRWGKFWTDLYLQRCTETKKLQFIRFTVGRRGQWFPRSVMLGVHMARNNYLPGHRGWEVFTNHLRFGWCKREKWQRFMETKWCGSGVDPWRAVSVRLGRLGFGCDVPRFISDMKDRREARLYELECEAYDQAMREQDDEGA